MHRPSDALSCDPIVVLTQRWLERAVIGLNLCPFAKSVHVKGQVHYAVSDTVDVGELLRVVQDEIAALLALDSLERDTTLVIAPQCAPDFFVFNSVVVQAERMVRRMGLEGTVQIASFHPHFQFAHEPMEAMSNYTNRAPFPILHLLREDSLSRAVQAFPDAEAIFERNIETMNRLGMEGWLALGVASPASQP